MQEALGKQVFMIAGLGEVAAEPGCMETQSVWTGLALVQVVGFNLDPDFPHSEQSERPVSILSFLGECGW
jgi:hypothetical protein